MSNDEPTGQPSDFHPLTEAILEAAEDLEKGRPLAAGTALPLNPTDLAWPEEAPIEVPAPVPQGELPAAPPAEFAAEAEPEPLADMAYEPVAEEPIQEEEAEEEEAVDKPPSLWKRLAAADPYTVLLAVAVTAVLVAMVCMLLELHSYGWVFTKKGVG
ncbi:MAG: hypothetical protein ACLQNE_40185 [Thermoguttaceae bacterium]